MVSAWISFSFGFFLGGGGSAGFFSQTLRFVDILLGHSPPSEDITLSCLVKTRESLGEKGHIVAVLRQDWDAADWIYSQLYCWVPMPPALTATGACATLWMFTDVWWCQKYNSKQRLCQDLGSLVKAIRGFIASQTFQNHPLCFSLFTSTVAWHRPRVQLGKLVRISKIPDRKAQCKGFIYHTTGSSLALWG